MIRDCVGPGLAFEKQVRLALSKMLTNEWESGKHLEQARILLDKRRKSERRILDAAFNCFMHIHQQIPMAWHGER